MTNNLSIPSFQLAERDQTPTEHQRGKRSNDLSQLPASITKTASKQTYYTIRFLVDRDRVLDAFRAYAYFRWVDDCLDQQLPSRIDRIAFIERQQMLVRDFEHGEFKCAETDEEHILADLMRGHYAQSVGLRIYIDNMMSVMAFDASRRCRVITRRELSQYSLWLSTAVTEALHYFIGHDIPSPETPTRYHAVIGAHVTHMLRDTYEDVAAGYFNIPSEFLGEYDLDPCDLTNEAYTRWIRQRVQFAQACFKAGKTYLAQVQSVRCRLAGYAYCARFEDVLNAIEQDEYRLRSTYLERKTPRGILRMLRSTLLMMMNGAAQKQS